jgi:four helix bundle protein
VSLHHHSLVAWQRADDLFIKVHQLSLKAFPAYERFELAAQLRRSAYSVAANIVEGFARRQPRNRLHFLNIAESSLAEVGYCIHVALRLGYITDDVAKDLESEVPNRRRSACGASAQHAPRSTPKRPDPPALPDPPSPRVLPAPPDPRAPPDLPPTAADAGPHRQPRRRCRSRPGRWRDEILRSPRHGCRF